MRPLRFGAGVPLTDNAADGSCAVPPMAIACNVSVPGAVPAYVNVATPEAFVVSVAATGFAPVTKTCTAKFPIGCASLSIEFSKLSIGFAMWAYHDARLSLAGNWVRPS